MRAQRRGNLQMKDACIVRGLLHILDQNVLFVKLQPPCFYLGQISAQGHNRCTHVNLVIPLMSLCDIGSYVSDRFFP